MSEAAILEVTGLQTAHGTSCRRDGGHGEWTFTVELSAWRMGGGVIERGELALKRQVDDEERDRLLALTGPDQLVRLLAAHSAGTWQLVDVLPRPVEDAELEALREKQVQPQFLEADGLPRFELYRRYDFWQATTRCGDGELQLTLPNGPQAALQNALGHLRDFLRDFAVRDAALRDYATGQLLALKNENWLDEDEEEQPLGHEQFAQRLVPSTLEMCPDGGFTFYYMDGDIFWGHAIEICGDMEKGPYSANLAG